MAEIRWYTSETQYETFTEEDFYDLSILEEISLTSETLPMNSATFTLNITENEMNTLVANSLYIKITHKGHIMGTFYFADSEKLMENKFTVTAYDCIYLLEDKLYWGGFYESDEETPISIIEPDIIKNTPIKRKLTESNSIKIGSGRMYIPFMTSREALSQVLFVSCLSCKSANDGSLEYKILSNKNTAITTINLNSIFDNYSVVENKKYNSVNIRLYGMQINGEHYPIEKFYPNSPSILIRKDVEVIDYVSGNYARYKYDTRNTPKIYAISEKEMILYIKWDNEATLVYPPFCHIHININLRNSITKEYTSISIQNFDDLHGKIEMTQTHQSRWKILPGYAFVIVEGDFRKYDILSYASGGAYAYNIEYIDGKRSVSSDYIDFNESPSNVVNVSDIYVENLTTPYLKTTEDLATYLMDNCYKYNKEFTGKILTEIASGRRLECGDTVTMNLPGIGQVRGIIKKLEYKNIVNKLIADATILLYLSDSSSKKKITYGVPKYGEAIYGISVIYE